MSLLKLHDLYFKPYIHKDEISAIVKRLATEVKADLPKGETPLFIGILNGCFLFVADFVRAFKGECEISFVNHLTLDDLSKHLLCRHLSIPWYFYLTQTLETSLIELSNLRR